MTGHLPATSLVGFVFALAACSGGGGGPGGAGGTATSSSSGGASVGGGGGSSSSSGGGSVGGGGSGGGAAGSGGATSSSSSGTGGSGAGGAGGTGTGGAGGESFGLPGFACTSCPPGFAGLDCSPVDNPHFGCGSGSACPVNGLTLHRDAVCASGQCAPGECQSGWADCDANPANGCEADLTLPAHCGSCGTVCSPGQLCTPSGCAAACPAGTVLCGTSCVSTASSPNHCGSCYHTCFVNKLNKDTSCTFGLCGAECKPGFVEHLGECVDPSTDKRCCGPSCTTCEDPIGGKAICNQGTCQSLCPPGRTLCGGQCALLATDLDHCGACNSPCNPGLCVNGACDPAAKSLLVTGVGAVESLVVDDVALYWAQPTGVMRVDKGGGSPSVLANGAPHRLAQDAGFVYWTEPGALRRVSKQGGSPELLATVGVPGDITVRDGLVYWADKASTSIFAVPVNGSASPATIAVDGHPIVEIEVDEAHLYWTHGAPGTGKLLRIAKDGQGPAQEVHTTEVGVLALDTDNIYTDTYSNWTVAERIGMGSIPGQTWSFGGLGTVDALLVDDTYAYLLSSSFFASSLGLELVRVLKCGSGQLKYDSGISNLLAVDGGFVYHVESGDLYRTPK